MSGKALGANGAEMVHGDKSYSDVMKLCKSSMTEILLFLWVLEELSPTTLKSIIHLKHMTEDVF